MGPRGGGGWRRWILIGLAWSGGCAGGIHTPEPPTPAPAQRTAPAVPTPTPSAPPSPSPSIPAPFLAWCEACHPQGGTVPGSGPSLRGVAERHSPDFLRQQIRNGRGDMPGFADRLSAGDLEGLLAYLRTLKGPPAPHRALEPPDPAAVRRGQALFRERCESCHLEGGRRPGVGLGFEPPAPALADVLRRHTPAFVAQQIREGGGQMPAIGADLSDEAIADLIAYLTALALEGEGR